MTTIQVTEIEITDTTAVNFSIKTEQGYDRLTGIAITADANATLAELFETTLGSGLMVGRKEVLPQDLGARNLYTGQEVCPNDRFFCLDECVDNTEVKGSLVNSISVASPYKLKVLLRLEKSKPA